MIKNLGFTIKKSLKSSQCNLFIMSYTRDTAWYENPDLKNLYLKAASNAMRGYHAPITSPKTTFTGTNSLTDFIAHLGAFLKENEKRVLIIVDKDLRKLGEKVQERLATLRGIESRIYDNIIPDVPKHTIFGGVEVCKEYDPKVIISIGGGSTMDTAKLIMLFYEKPNLNINTLPVPSYVGLRKKVYWLVAIPTTSGTGAETTAVAVVTDTDRDPPRKTVVYIYELCPDFAVLVPDFVKTMPPYLTIGSGMDALAHAMGSYVLTMSKEFNDMCNIKAIELVLKYLPRAVKRGDDMEAREKMQMAAYIAGLGFGNVAAGIEHTLGHAFGATFHVHHGVCVGLFLCASIAYQSKVTNRFKDLAKLFNININGKQQDEILRELLECLREFMRSINFPVSISELEQPKISKEDYIAKTDQLVDFAFNDIDTLFSTRKIDPPQYRRIIELSYENKMEYLMDLFYK